MDEKYFRLILTRTKRARVVRGALGNDILQERMSFISRKKQGGEVIGITGEYNPRSRSSTIFCAGDVRSNGDLVLAFFKEGGYTTGSQSILESLKIGFQRGVNKASRPVVLIRNGSNGDLVGMSNDGDTFSVEIEQLDISLIAAESAIDLSVARLPDDKKKLIYDPEYEWGLYEINLHPVP